MTHPTTDIVVLTHNSGSIIYRFFDALYKNTTNFMLYVVDNNSKKDDTVPFLRKKAKELSNFTLIENKENFGVASGRNLGLQAGNSEYCICLDDDQLVSKNWLSDLFIIHSKGYDIVGIDAWQMNPPTHKIKPYFPIKHCQTKHHKYSYLGGGGTLFKKTAIEQIGFFDPFYSPFFFEDSDAFMSWSKLGYKSAWHYAAKVLHLGHQSVNKQRDFSKIKQFQKNYEYFVKKWTPYFPPYGNMILLERHAPEAFLK